MVELVESSPSKAYKEAQTHVCKEAQWRGAEDMDKPWLRQTMATKDMAFPTCKPHCQGIPATFVHGETPQKDVSCVDSCSASGQELCLQKPGLCVETQLGSAQN